ncbi:MAG: ATP-dependent DNA helicase RecG [Fimbriimonadales bacterium]|nr:ATP-dependent DNA helicase RecG [Fimbriimonadales bacterium]
MLGPPSLDFDVQFVKGVGPRGAKQLAKLGVRTARDLLYRLPRRYVDRSSVPPIAEARPGEAATVRGRVVHFETRRARSGMVILTAVLDDGTGTIQLTWFNQPWISRKLEGYQGEAIAYGAVRAEGWTLTMQGPEFELVDDPEDAADFARIVPVYPLAEGVPQGLVRKAVRGAVERLADSVADPLPADLRRRYGLRPLGWCLRNVHFPPTLEDAAAARDRMAFEELLHLQLRLALRRAETLREAGIAFPIAAMGERLWEEIRRMLPFELTGAQRRVIGEILRDMESPHPMNRLVQGDVGSGKTAVAASAMLAAVRAGYQAALMAPTEILAEQHYNNLRRYLDPLGIHVTLMVGKLTKRQKERARNLAATGQTHVAVGTHALVQEDVGFDRLGLAVIDEQPRFGVLQRAALRGKGFGNPDVLVMTATPIPRTLTMALYGDLDVSVLDELPPGRRPVKTHWKRPDQRPQVYQGVRELIARGSQAYIVCPMVSESEKMQAQAAEELHRHLSEEVFPDLRVGLLHGQMKAKQKEDVMEAFRRGDLDILVSTTVIEVGVDVPNASVMVIEDANRFGLSQLHQLRGRVGRGAHQSFCILVADAGTEDARQRMEAMVSTNDGFRIAEIDLRLRGPGELCGTRQSGNLDLEVADLIRDAHLLERAREAAAEIVAMDPGLERPEHAGLAEGVRKLDPVRAAIVQS